jgi:hypothetical protein
MLLTSPHKKQFELKIVDIEKLVPLAGERGSSPIHSAEGKISVFTSFIARE